MAITIETGKVSYAAGYAYDTITKGTQSFPFTATYDSETNCTTVEFGTCQHEFYNRKNGVVAVTLITVEDASDSSNAQSTIFYSNDSSVVTTKIKFTGSPWNSTLVIQHNNDLGQKSIKVSASTQIRCFPNSSSVDSGNALTYTGSGSVSVSLGSYGGDVLYNEGFLNRQGCMSISKWPATGYLRAFAFSLSYRTKYDPVTNSTTVTLTNAKVRQRGVPNMNGTCNGTISITPLDNTGGAKTTTMTYTEVTSDSVKYYYPDIKETVIIVKHSEGEAALKQIKITVDATFTVYVSSSSKWTITAALTSPTLYSGSTNSKQFGIPIEDGEGFQFYDVFIDNGKAWQKATMMFDRRTEWVKVQ